MVEEGHEVSRFLSTGFAATGPQDVWGYPAGLAEHIQVSPLLDIPQGKPARRVSVRDHGAQLTRSGTTARVNGQRLKDSLFQGGM